MHEHPGNRFAPSFSCPPTISVVSLHHQPWWNWAKKQNNYQVKKTSVSPFLTFAKSQFGMPTMTGELIIHICAETLACLVMLHARNWVVITLNGSYTRSCGKINSSVCSVRGEDCTQFHVFIWDGFHHPHMHYNLLSSLHQTTVLKTKLFFY